MAIGWIDAADALARLKVRPQTLYAYVSRGRVQARPDPADPRKSLYSLPDVERLALSSRAVRRPSAVAAGAISWGEPMLASAISTVKAGRLVYRGVDAVTLSETVTLEEVAVLLWGAPDDLFINAWDARAARGDMIAAIAGQVAASPPLLDLADEVLQAGSVAILRRLVACAGGQAGPIHQALAQAWGAPDAADAIRRALVLLADHELNVSTFAVRVTASSGASLAASVLAGLCALSGPRHGAAPAQAAALVEMTEDDLGARFEAHGYLPGFGHPLYAGVDARAAALLSAFDVPPLYRRLRRVVRRRCAVAPNIDFALAALAEHFALPPGAPQQLFAIARSVGWMAHAVEQVRDGGLIRPRARYVGN